MLQLERTVRSCLADAGPAPYESRHTGIEANDPQFKSRLEGLALVNGVELVSPGTPPRLDFVMEGHPNGPLLSFRMPRYSRERAFRSFLKVVGQKWQCQGALAQLGTLVVQTDAVQLVSSIIRLVLL